MAITHLNLNQTTSSIEVVTSAIIDKLYELAQTNLDETSNVQGNLQVVHAYEDAVTYLLNKFPNLQINVTQGAYIRFADSAVASICATNWGDGIGTSLVQASIVNTLNNKFSGNTNIISFDELAKFTNVIKLNSAEFRGCLKLKSINLKNCSDIEGEVFLNCTALQSLGDTTNITYLGGYNIFANCSSLNIDLNFPNLQVGNGTVFDNSAIKSIVSLGRITVLDLSFHSCNQLRSVILPNTLQDITYSTFYNCSSLLWVKLLSTSLCTLTKTDAFDNANNCKLYVPDNLVDSYKSASGWSSYSSRIFSLTQFAIDFPNG